MQVWHFRKFNAAKVSVTGILSLPNVGWDIDSEEDPMRKVVASELMSLDGVVESPEKWHFPYFNDEMAEAIRAAMAASDAMMLGRVTSTKSSLLSGLTRSLLRKTRRLRTT